MAVYGSGSQTGVQDHPSLKAHTTSYIYATQNQVSILDFLLIIVFSELLNNLTNKGGLQVT